MNRQNDVRKENSMKRKNYFSLLSCMLGALLFGNTLFPTLTVTAQEETKAGSTAEYRNEETNEPVSYTHLDVYKRQDRI